MVCLVGLVWRWSTNQNIRAVTLLSATLLAVPLALLYDRMLLLVAIGWLVRDARTDSFLPWEKTSLIAVFLGSLADYAIGSAWHLPLGPVISATVLAMAMRRLARARAVPETPGAMSSAMNHAPVPAR
jgi:hypothetical protein